MTQLLLSAYGRNRYVSINESRNVRVIMDWGDENEPMARTYRRSEER